MPHYIEENTIAPTNWIYFEKRLERFFQRSPNQALSKLNVAPILTHAYERALQPHNMTGLFGRLGICPFNNLSTSIGAYLNIPDDFDQDEAILNHDENVEHEQGSSGSGSSAHWGVVNTPSFNLQATLGLDSSNSGGNRPPASHILISASSGRPVIGEEGSANMSMSTAPTGLTPCVRVVPTISTSHTTVGKQMQLLALPKRLATSGSHIAIRLAQQQPNSTPRGVIVSNSDHASVKQQSPHLPPESYHLDEDVNRAGVVMEEVVTTMDAEETGTNIVEDIEEGEAPGLCAVCCQLEPPGFDPDALGTSESDCQVVDWAHCDYCNLWVHLNSECSRNAVITDNSFMCALCRGFDEEEVVEEQQLVSLHGEKKEITQSLSPSVLPDEPSRKQGDREGTSVLVQTS